jgi:methylenetetrahydrofolate dehydrogenase (NADP+)/methenyltetrahydrofolate cyclohydrolase
MSHESAVAANILDGAAVARRIRERVRSEVESFCRGGRPSPRLEVLLVGNDPASETYVAAKTEAARLMGLRADTVRLPAESPPSELLDRISRVNRDPDIDGLLVQLPLPGTHDTRRVLDAIDPWKDVDGFHPENVGLLQQGRPRFTPCTPAGILALLDAYAVPLSGRRAVVLGRSDVVGKPMAALLTSRDATVTLAHSKTRDLPDLCREADLLVAAIGRAGFVTPDFVRPGATVVDVGINRLTSIGQAPENLGRSDRIRRAIEARGRALVGDVDFDAVGRVAGLITPVPGGVGPLTVAMLLSNTLQAARLKRSNAR